MLETLRKLMLASIGALSLTKEKTEQLVRELSERGQLSSTEARKLVSELLEKGEKEKETIQKTVNSEVQKMREEWGLVNKRDLLEVNARLARIEEQLFGPGKDDEAGRASGSGQEQ